MFSEVTFMQLAQVTAALSARAAAESTTTDAYLIGILTGKYPPLTSEEISRYTPTHQTARADAQGVKSRS